MLGVLEKYIKKKKKKQKTMANGRRRYERDDRKIRP